MKEQSLRSVIDEITLEVAQYRPAEDLEALIAAKTMDYIAKLCAEQPMLTSREIDRVTSAVIAGVLTRLEQIAISGGQIGSA